MTVFDNIASAVTTSWEQNTVIWIVISAVIGGVLTQVFKFVFENSIPQWQRKRATRIAIQKYSSPITQSALNVLYTIRDILIEPDIVNDQNLRLSMLYDFGCFFGWIEILLKESFVERLEAPDQKLKRHVQTAKYHRRLLFLLANIIKDISGYQYSEDEIAYKRKMKKALSFTSHWPLDAIGQLMIDKPEEKSNYPYSRVIDIVKFIQNYERSDDFKKLFKYIDDILSGVRESKLNPQWNLLVSLLVHILLFSAFVGKKSAIIPPEWIPSIVKLITSKILWGPRKIKKYVYIIQLSAEVRRQGLNASKDSKEDLVKMREYILGGYDQFKAEFKVENPKKIVIYNNDGIKHNAMHIPKIYPYALKMLIGESMYTQLRIAEILTPILDRHYLNDSILDYITLELDVEDYLAIINKPYDDYMLNLNQLLQKEPENAEIWNRKGILCICSLGMSHRDKRRYESSTKVGYREAIKCYNKALQLKPDYSEAWNNMGLAYLEMDKRKGDWAYNDYEMAKECFEKAIECINKALENAKKNQDSKYSQSLRETLADMYNNLGVSYYGLQAYDKAIECFDIALKVKYFSLAEDNRTITLEKLDKGNPA